MSLDFCETAQKFIRWLANGHVNMFVWVCEYPWQQQNIQFVVKSWLVDIDKTKALFYEKECVAHFLYFVQSLL